MSYLVVGLGNPGAEYKGTRHNIGFEVVDQLATLWKTDFSLEKNAYLAQVRYRSKPVYLIKPTTYMNLSGKAVQYYANQYKVPKSQMLVVVDDLALPFGTLRIRGKGSAAGHNGLKNIEQLLGGQDYPRLRFGVGDAFHKGKQVDFVLGRFTAEEQKEIPDLLTTSCLAIESFLFRGLSQTMTAFNTTK